MLEDGIRFLDVQLCKDQESLVVCSDTTLSTNTFQNVLEKAFTFARNEVEQFFIVHVKSNNVNTREIETILDQVCEVHTNQTQGTDEFVKGKCPFVYTYRPEKGPWKSMGEIVNYDPEMAQWEGDGELVGVRTKFMLTVSDDVIQPSDYASSYVTPVFWRSLDNTIDSLDGFKQGLAQLCRVPGYGIGLGSFGALNNKIYHPDYLEDALLNRDGCNLNDSPLNTFFTHILVDHYEDQLPYLKELERRMMDLNYAKWTGNYRMMTPSLFRKKKVERDEL
ncbi:uncharacterized protein B0P05DRAFT_538212 [Gilbertella persicaria]|uniref:uncharacterized protein n=1 Tax=Gilbertella persicaria TaxID=101096 RepID=UPI0022201F47|nr:uncharacterized protein B0P05DRAFT_538212 [Gilbertella persicaria]KAI8081826.1 hypothetical protein B0P05DRAFT_538212 [Gilbertella persicaria]